MVVSLAARVDPEHLNYVLIDYKGGSAFDACAALPHVVGVVTDLDEHLARRALTCLEAELRHRERLLREVGAQDLPTYLAAAHEQPLPRLLIVIDEFAAMAKELPEFMDALVDIAARGRSLGVHLLLATQRPAGVIKDNIRANSNLRLSLRVQSTTDSKDVIGDAAAANLPRSLPGRGYVRFGPSELVPFQTALSTGVSGRAGTDVIVSSASFSPEPPPARQRRRAAWAPHRPGATRRCHCRRRRANQDAPRQNPVAGHPSRHRRADRPARWDRGRRAAFRSPWSMSPRSSGCPPGGGTRDGGTSSATGCPGRGSMSSSRPSWLPPGWGSSTHRAMPTCSGSGLIVSTTWPIFLTSVRWWRPTTGSVRSGCSASCAASWRGDAAAAHISPRLLLVIDDYAGLRAAFDGYKDVQLLEMVARLIADGAALGINVVACGRQAMAIPLRVAGTVATRLAFAFADPMDVTILGLRLRNIPTLTHGRAVDATSGLIVQAATAWSGVRVPEVEPRPYPVEVMPDMVERGEMGSASITEGCWRIPVGIGELELGPVDLVLDLSDHALVGGGPRTGKSTLMATLAEAAGELARCHRHRLRPPAQPAARERSPPHRHRSRPTCLR